MLAVRREVPGDEPGTLEAFERRDAVCWLMPNISPMLWVETKMEPRHPPLTARTLRHWRSSAGIIVTKFELLAIYELLCEQAPPWFVRCRMHVR